MSLAEDSPVNSSSSDDFAAFLDAELDTASYDASVDSEEVLEEENDNGDEDEDDLDLNRVKRRKTALSEDIINPQIFSSPGETAQVVVGSSSKKNACSHPFVYARMCTDRKQKTDDEPGLPFRYIHKHLRLAKDEIDRLRRRDLKNLLRRRKLCLVLDLDHTLLNSALLPEITEEEGHLNGQRDALPDTLKSSLFRLEQMHMMTKLRPFVRKFLKEASNLFEMYIYTMGERPYAKEMAKLLDPADFYFNSRVIAQGDCTPSHKKSLDIVLVQESAIIIHDDTEEVWDKHKENLILVERYHYFASSCKQSKLKDKSLSERKIDESETEGALANVLTILQRIHSLFFDPGREDSLEDRDVRQVLSKEVLKGCKVVFSHVFRTDFRAPLMDNIREAGSYMLQRSRSIYYTCGLWGCRNQ